MRYFLLLLFVAVVGCGKNENETARVEGTVTLNGQPLTSGIVTFFPEAGRSARGIIQSDGTFALGTYEKADGALVGMHKVTVVAQGSSNRPNFDSDNVRQSASASPIPVQYANPTSSGLTFEVKAGEVNHPTFDLKK